VLSVLSGVHDVRAPATRKHDDLVSEIVGMSAQYEVDSRMRELFEVVGESPMGQQHDRARARTSLTGGTDSGENTSQSAFQPGFDELPMRHVRAYAYD
jgi:hypothetical protein